MEYMPAVEMIITLINNKNARHIRNTFHFIKTGMHDA
jgi:hypothetical protein